MLCQNPWLALECYWFGIDLPVVFTISVSIFEQDVVCMLQWSIKTLMKDIAKIHNIWEGDDCKPPPKKCGWELCCSEWELPKQWMGHLSVNRRIDYHMWDGVVSAVVLTWILALNMWEDWLPHVILIDWESTAALLRHAFWSRVWNKLFCDIWYWLPVVWPYQLAYLCKMLYVCCSDQ